MWFDQPIEVIPAVDVLGDEAVRLHQGDYDDVVERADTPTALARRWAAAGAGARASRRPGRGTVRPGKARTRSCGGLGGRARAAAGIGRDPDARRRAGPARRGSRSRRRGDGGMARPDAVAGARRGTGARARRARRRGSLLGLDTGGRALVRRCARASAGSRPRPRHLDRPRRHARRPGPRPGARATATGLRVLAAGGIRSPADVQALAAAGAEAAIVGRALLL